MYEYLLKDDCEINNKKGGFTVIKGSEILSDGYIDEDNGIKGIVNSGDYKGIVIIFSADELELVK
jgi:deoxycytidylate deaminase